MGAASDRVYNARLMFDIGSSLREARVRQDLDFPELEERTKIRPKYLRALEDERFDILPAPDVRARVPPLVCRVTGA